VSSAEKHHFGSEKTKDKKPKKTMRDRFGAFMDFNRSPILKKIDDIYNTIPTAQEVMSYINRLPERAKEYAENKKLELLAAEYRESSVTDQYIKYAGRKLLLRNEIQLLA
jgi:hypothetical protein